MKLEELDASALLGVSPVGALQDSSFCLISENPLFELGERLLGKQLRNCLSVSGSLILLKLFLPLADQICTRSNRGSQTASVWVLPLGWSLVCGARVWPAY